MSENTITIQQLKWGKAIIVKAMALPKKQQYAALNKLTELVGESVYREMRNYYEATEWWKKQCEEEERKGNMSAKAAAWELTKLEQEMALGWDVLWGTTRDPQLKEERKATEAAAAPKKLSKGAEQVARLAMVGHSK